MLHSFKHSIHIRRSAISLLIVAWAITGGRTRLAAEPFQRIAKLTPAVNSGDSVFGLSVSLDHLTGLVAARNSESLGVTYVYRDIGGGDWTKIASLSPTTPESGDQFGWSTSLSGSTALVGAPSAGGGGAVYVFKERDNGQWGQVANLVPAGAILGRGFGWSVSVDGPAAIVGAYSENGFKGAAYLFLEDEDGSWHQISRLSPSVALGQSEFGSSVSLRGSTAIVGAITELSGNGAAYIFRNDGQDNWQQIARLAPAGETGETDFGSAVSLDGSTAVVGAPWTDNRAGAAFVYREDASGNWHQIAKLTPDDSQIGQSFGLSVSLSGTTALVGSFSFGRPGTAYVFQENDLGRWNQIAKLTGDRLGSDDAFGYSVSLSGANAFVGDLLDKQRTGAAYIFSVPEPSTGALTVTLLFAAAVAMKRRHMVKA